MNMKCIASAFAFTLFFGLIGIFLIPSSVIYILYYPFLKYPEDKFQYLSSRIYRIFFMVLPKIKLSVSLKENLPDSAVYVSTHLSHFDYPILGSFIERYIIMTRLNFRKIPLISTIGKLIGIRYLDKDNLNNISHVYDEFRKNLQENRNVILDFNYDNDNVNCCPAGNGWLVGVLPVKLNGHGEQFHIGEGGKLLFV